ncbi:MAG TPA: hypothetical protein DCL81_04245 [Algoriphagus sp.]|nr:hypothetical protein [Algoriphagus sp.]HAH35761.1 hypothetical protein [Algoriphagus sp.]
MRGTGNIELALLQNQDTIQSIDLGGDLGQFHHDSYRYCKNASVELQISKSAQLNFNGSERNLHPGMKLQIP